MHNVLPCNIHWQDKSQEDNILKAVATFQNSSHFYHYISSHDFHKLSQSKKHSRIVYGFDETFIILAKFSYNILHYKPWIVLFLKKKSSGEMVSC